MERIRPSLKELRAQSEMDELAFPELDGPPSVKVSRTGPPKIIRSTGLPPPIPTIPPPSEPAAPAGPAPKPKSRFALQREREAVERAAQANAASSQSSGALPQGSGMFSLIGNVVERSASGPPTPPSAPGPAAPSPLANKARATGFPASVHMGFPRKAAVTDVPTVGETVGEAERWAAPAAAAAAVHGGGGAGEGDAGDVGGLLAAISRENAGVLANMSEDDIFEEQRQIRESLGLSPGVLAMLQARATKASVPAASTSATHVPTNAPPVTGPPLPKIRPAPVRTAQAKPSPTLPSTFDDGEEEGSPEYIRRHFFPNEPRNPALDWMRNDPKLSTLADPSNPSTANSTLAFDLSGALSAMLGAAAPAGDSHHASSDGTFTIPGILSLTASSVPSQRSTALLVLARVITHQPSHQETLGLKDYQQLRVAAAGRAVFGLRDPNQGAAAAAIALILALLEPERDLPPPPPLSVSGAEPLPTVLSTILNGLPLTVLAGHLTLATLPPTTLSQVLAIFDLLLALPPAVTTDRSDGVTLATQMVNTPGLLDAVSDRFVAVAWPPVGLSPGPVAQGLELLIRLARTSRAAAKAVVECKLHEHPLRFLAMPPWELDEPRLRSRGYHLLSLSLQLWESLGRYGLGARLWTQGTALFGTLTNRLFAGNSIEDELLTTDWLNLLATWATVAVDPHVSEHDILWSQVQGWEDLALSTLDWANAQPGGCGAHAPLTAAAWDLLANWLEGSKVNRPWRGEQERQWVSKHLGAEFSYGGRADVALRHAIKKQGEEQARMVLAAIRLSDAYEEETEPKSGPLLEWKPATLGTLFGRRPPSWASVRIRVGLLKWLGNAEARVKATVELLPLMRAGDEVAARDLTAWLTTQLSTAASVAQVEPLHNLDQLEVDSLAKVDLLRPFLTHAIVTPSGGRVTGPLNPTPKDIKLTAALPLLAKNGTVAEPKLLLPPSWPLTGLNELLRSGSSVVLQQLPNNWHGSELEVVRASLALMRAIRLLAQPNGPAGISPAELVYQLIKVFMLEKDHPAPAAGAPAADKDLFRHPAVQHSIAKLLDSVSIGSSTVSSHSSTASGPPPLEAAHSAASSAPLFQLFSDLAGLYAAISLGDASFSRVLLPFLRTAFAVDYRRLLWVDYADSLRAITTPATSAASDAPGLGLGAWLEPVEEDEVVLLAYADAVVKGRVTRERNEFMFGVAVHHLSGALFGRAREGDGARRRRLAGALVQPGRGEIVKVLLGYDEKRSGGEAGFGFGSVGEGVVAERVGVLGGLLDGAGQDRLNGLAS